MAYNWWDVPPATDEMADHAEVQRRLRLAGFGAPEAPPQMEAAPGIRLGPLKVGGGTLDNLAASVLQTPMPGNMRGAQGVAGGFAQGFARARAGRAQGRQAKFEAASEAAAKRNAAADSFRASAANAVSQERQLRNRPEKPTAAAKTIEQIEAEAAARARGSASAPTAASMASADAKRKEEDEKDYVMDEAAKAAASMDPSRPPGFGSARNPMDRLKYENRVNFYLKQNGSPYSFRDLEQLYDQQKKFMASQNAQRFINVRQAVPTVRQHMDQFKEFFDKYEATLAAERKARPMEWRLFNKGVFEAAKNGLLGPQAAQDAAALETTASVLSDESALVFAGGYAPQAEQIKDARQRVTVMLGPGGKKGSVMALEKLLEARIKNLHNALPFYGGKTNPYLLEVSPLEGWNEAAGKSGYVEPPAQNTTTPETQKPGGKAGKYGG